MVAKAEANFSLQYNTGTDTWETFDTTTGNYIPWNPWDYYPDYHHYYYPTTTIIEDKVSKSFKIVQKLMEKKIIKTLTIKGFIELVNEISMIV